MAKEEFASVRPIMSDVEYAAIIALEGNREFQIIRDFIARRAISTAVMSTERTGEQCHWLQGRSQELKDLNNCIKKARENFEAIRRSDPGKK